jgi:hypothetical protein
MAKATAPEICKTAATLAAKWEKLRRSPAEPALKTPQISWPAGPRQQEAQGREKFLFCVYTAGNVLKIFYVVKSGLFGADTLYHVATPFSCKAFSKEKMKGNKGGGEGETQRQLRIEK